MTSVIYLTTRAQSKLADDLGKPDTGSLRLLGARTDVPTAAEIITQMVKSKSAILLLIVTWTLALATAQVHKDKCFNVGDTVTIGGQGDAGINGEHISFR